MATVAQLSSALTALHLPPFTPQFLTPILSSSSSTTARQQPPLASLAATAKSRCLAADIHLSSIILSSAPSFPANLSSVHVPSAVLGESVFVQVLDIEDLGRSKWEQIEALEAERNGELKKGREIIRVAPAEDNDPSSAATQQPNTQASAAQTVSKGPFKLLLQDHKGVKIYAFELKKVEKIALPLGISIGCKVLLRKGCKVARGMVLLEPVNVLVFGGRIEGLDKGWRERREARLRKEVEADAARERDR